MTLREYLLTTTTTLEKAGVDSPRLSAEVLLAHALQVERNELLKRLIMEPEQELNPERAEAALALAARRAQGEPVAYVVGCKEFYGRDFTVTPATLIPRPDTELLVDLALNHAAQLQKQRSPVTNAFPLLFADLGTGSGCIAVTLALELPAWEGVATDISKDALRVAHANARAHEVKNLSFARANFIHPLFAPQSLFLLVSNPPYISTEALHGLSPEVRDFEPQSALVPTLHAGAQASGLEHISQIIEHAATALRPQGILLMEIGYDQGQAALALCPASCWRHAALHQDLAGHDRVLVAERC